MSDQQLREELESLRRELASLSASHRARRRGLRAAILVGLVALAGVAVAQPVLKSFTGGDPANATEVNTNFSQLAAFTVPPGAVMTFDLPACPTGWTAFAEGQGRALVGKPTTGTLKRVFGGAFNGDAESNHAHGGATAAAGDHLHGGVTNGWVNWIQGTVNYTVQVGFVSPYHIQESITTDVRGSHTHNLGGTLGSSVIPYVYLTVCKKN